MGSLDRTRNEDYGDPEIADKKRGRVAVVQSKTGHLISTVFVTECIQIPVTHLSEYFDKHQVPDDWIQKYAGSASSLFGWTLCDARCFVVPRPYTHTRRVP